MNELQPKEWGLIDIHAHLLPIQDGPKTLVDAVMVIEKAARSQISKMIMTPHFFYGDRHYDLPAIHSAFDRLRRRVQELGLPIEIYLGSELHIDKHTAEALENGETLPLAGTSYVLSEYPFYQIPCNYESSVYELMQCGYKPIIAHPERNPYVVGRYELLQELKSMGCMIQINAASLLGDHGESIRKMARKMLTDGLADILASDSHSLVSRPPDVLARAMRKVEQLVGLETAYKLYVENPGRIFKGEPT